MTAAPTDSILAADIGSITTRVALFDIVTGEFRFVAAGEARSTVEPPFSYIGEGLRQAMDQLHTLTGRALIDGNDQLILPGRTDGAGIDAFAVSASAGKPLRMALVGLMPNLSLASLERVALSAPVAIVERLALGDRRRVEKQIDDLIAAKPELVVIAGGTDYGSQGAVLQLADTVATAAKQMRAGTRPEILFVGNAALHGKVKALFEGLGEVSIAENVRPRLEEENIISARRYLARIYERVRLGNIAGYGELAQWSGVGVTPNAVALGNIVHHLSQTWGKTLLGVDVGSATTTLVASTGEEHTATVRADLGVGHSAAYLTPALERLARWLPAGYADDELRDYLASKSIHPTTVPAELHELYIEHALARVCLQQVVQSANWPAKVKGPPGLPPHFDTLIGAGAVLARAPKPGQAALMLIDGVQPTGVTHLLLDWEGLLPMLGAAAILQPVAVVQALSAGALLNLGAVVTFTGAGRPRQNAGKVKINLPNGQTIKADVTFGSLEVHHLPPGEVKATIQPAGGFDAGAGRGVAKTISLSDCAVGLIIDARGRPIPPARHETVAKWCAALGEYG